MEIDQNGGTTTEEEVEVEEEMPTAKGKEELAQLPLKRTATEISESKEPTATPMAITPPAVTNVTLVAPNHWECGTCTFHNALTNERCEMCDTPRKAK